MVIFACVRGVEFCGKKQKNKGLEIRVSEKEYNEYKNAAQRQKLTLSDWARRCLACRTVYVDYAPQMLEVVADLQTCLNKPNLRFTQNDGLIAPQIQLATAHFY